MRLDKFVRKEKAKFAADPKHANILGVLVSARPEKTEAVIAALGRMPGVEIHTSAPDGRIVITIEDKDGNWAGGTAAVIHEIPGVITAALVYHQTHSGDLEEEMPQ